MKHIAEAPAKSTPTESKPEICSKCGEPRTAPPPEDLAESARKILEGAGISGFRIRCRCERERQEADEARRRTQEFEDRVRRHLAGAGFPPIYAAAELETIPLQQLSRERRAAVIHVAQSFVENASSTCFLIGGDQGVGKTELAVATARAAIRAHGLSVMYWNHPGIMNREVRRRWSRDEYGEAEAIFERGEQCDLLLLDEVGLVTLSGRDLERFYALVDYRYTHRRPWIATTNHDRRGMEEKVGRPIADRLLDTRMTITVNLGGTSYRQS